MSHALILEPCRSVFGTSEANDLVEIGHHRYEERAAASSFAGNQDRIALRRINRRRSCAAGSCRTRRRRGVLILQVLDNIIDQPPSVWLLCKEDEIHLRLSGDLGDPQFPVNQCTDTRSVTIAPPLAPPGRPAPAGAALRRRCPRFSRPSAGFVGVARRPEPRASARLRDRATFAQPSAPNRSILTKTNSWSIISFKRHTRVRVRAWAAPHRPRDRPPVTQAPELTRSPRAPPLRRVAAPSLPRPRICSPPRRSDRAGRTTPPDRAELSPGVCDASPRGRLVPQHPRPDREGRVQKRSERIRQPPRAPATAARRPRSAPPLPRTGEGVGG